MKLPPIIPKTYITSSAEKIFDTITSSGGWDSWFTTGSEIKVNEEGKGYIKFVWKDWGPDNVSVKDSGEILCVK